MNSLTDVMQLLAPASSTATKFETPGNCVVVLFYTKFCPGCQALVPHWNALARNFLDIKVIFNNLKLCCHLILNMSHFLSGWSIGCLRESRFEHRLWNHWTAINCSFPQRADDPKVQHKSACNRDELDSLHPNAHKSEACNCKRCRHVRGFQSHKSVESDYDGRVIRRLPAPVLDLYYCLRSLLLHKIKNLSTDCRNDQQNLERIE